MPTGDPTQHIYRPRVAHIPGQPVGDNFAEEMGARVFEIVDIRLDVYAIDSGDRSANYPTAV